MLLVLGGILPSGPLLGFAKDNPLTLLENGNNIEFSNSQKYASYSGSSPVSMRNLPIAILVNNLTASSGEITALALKAQAAGVRVFGNSTAGKTSANYSYDLAEGKISITAAQVYDANGIMATAVLSVDEEIDCNLQDIFSDDDPVILAGATWITCNPRATLEM